jgi:hypothetical protein
VTEQAEARDVGRGADAGRDGDLGGGGSASPSTCVSGARARRAALALERRREHAGAERLREQQPITRRAPAFVSMRRRSTTPVTA